MSMSVADVLSFTREQLSALTERFHFEAGTEEVIASQILIRLMSSCGCMKIACLFRMAMSSVDENIQKTS